MDLLGIRKMVEMNPTQCCVCNKALHEDQINEIAPYLSLDLRSVKYAKSHLSGLLAFHISCFEAVSGQFYADSVFTQMQKAETVIRNQK